MTSGSGREGTQRYKTSILQDEVIAWNVTTKLNLPCFECEVNYNCKRRYIQFPNHPLLSPEVKHWSPESTTSGPFSFLSVLVDAEPNHYAVMQLLSCLYLPRFPCWGLVLPGSEEPDNNANSDNRPLEDCTAQGNNVRA